MTSVKQPYQELFDYLSNELNTIATQTQMQEIEAIILSNNAQIMWQNCEPKQLN